MAKSAIEAIKAMKFTFVLKSDKTFRMEMRSVQAGKQRESRYLKANTQSQVTK